jgi:hypothetical protein
MHCHCAFLTKNPKMLKKAFMKNVRLVADEQLRVRVLRAEGGRLVGDEQVRISLFGFVHNPIV